MGNHQCHCLPDKDSKIAKPIKLAQPALFVAKRGKLPENAGKSRLDHPLLMLPTTHKNTGNARYIL